MCVLCGNERRIVVCSAYFPSNAKDSPLPEQVRGLIRYREADGLDLVTGCDANSQNSVWGNSDCNNRGEALLEFLDITNLEILNEGCKPTFRNSVREVVLNILLVSGKVGTRLEPSKD